MNAPSREELDLALTEDLCDAIARRFLGVIVIYELRTSDPHLKTENTIGCYYAGGYTLAVGLAGRARELVKWAHAKAAEESGDDAPA